jgi:hypothetical protein
MIVSDSISRATKSNVRIAQVVPQLIGTRELFPEFTV